MTERELQQAVLELARLLRWSCYHTFDSRRSEHGWPDLVLVRPPRLVAAELKSEQGRLTPAQLGWLDLLRQVPGVETAEWRPRDWIDGTIEQTLRRAA